MSRYTVTVTGKRILTRKHTTYKYSLVSPRSIRTILDAYFHIEALKINGVDFVIDEDKQVTERRVDVFLRLFEDMSEIIT